MPDARKKVVIVTGASAGIGASIARELARQGHDLVLTARREDRLRELADELTAATAGRPIEVLVVAAALDDPATPERVVAESVARFGGLDVLINNAGFGLPTLFADGDPRDLRRQLEVNLVAPLLMTRYALPHLLERRGGGVHPGPPVPPAAQSAAGCP